jgi:hypothetical protein
MPSVSSGEARRVLMPDVNTVWEITTSASAIDGSYNTRTTQGVVECRQEGFSASKDMISFSHIGYLDICSVQTLAPPKAEAWAEEITTSAREPRGEMAGQPVEKKESDSRR